MIRSSQTASLVLAAALTTFASSATFAGYAMPAPETGPENSANWYIGLFGGGVMVDNVRNLNSTTGDVYSTKFKETYDIGFNFGYRASTFRFEGQYTFSDADVKSIKNLTTGAVTTPPDLDVYGTGLSGDTGRLKAHILMANMLYDFQGQSDAWGYYVGLGAGWAKLTGKYRLDSTSYQGGTIDTDFKANENKFAYQGMFGVTYSTDYHFVYDLGLRYLKTAKLVKVSNKALAMAFVNLNLTYQVPV